MPHRRLEGRDIGWVKAVAFKRLRVARTLITLYGPDKHFECYSMATTRGLSKGGRKENAQTNIVFRRLHGAAHFHMPRLRPPSFFQHYP